MDLDEQRALAARFLMLYCDQMHCRVNTFENGEGNGAGQCPGCEVPGLPVPTRN